MEQFMNFWENISSIERVLILMGGMIFFWVLEGYYSLFRFSYKRYKHAGVNLIFLTTTIILNLVFGFFTIQVCDWVMKNDFGLLNLISMPLWVRIMLGLLFMDFLASMRLIS